MYLLVVYLCLLFAGGPPGSALPVGTTPPPGPHPPTAKVKENNRLKLGTQIVPLANNSLDCTVQATNPDIPASIAQLVEKSSRLIEYDFTFEGYNTNPLLDDVEIAYAGNQWTLATTAEGKTILALAFDYGALSLMTLEFGVKHLDVELKDEPRGCFGNLTERDKMQAMVVSGMRHFQGPDSEVVVKTTSSLCHQVVQEKWNFALFTYQCCHQGPKGLAAECSIHDGNVWLNTIDALLLTIRVLALFTIGVWVTSGVFREGHVCVPYVIKRDLPLRISIRNHKAAKKERVSIQTQKINDEKHTTVAIHNEEIKCKLAIDIRKEHGFARYKQFLKAHEEVEGKTINVSMERIHIVVEYELLQGEQDIPVGFFRSIGQAVFSCGLEHTEPFKECCQTKLFKLCSSNASPKWITFFNPLSKLLLILIIPLVFYVRIIFYYVFEHDEVTYRHGRAQLVGLTMSPNKFNLIDYVKPTDALFIVIYILYLMTAVLLGYLVYTGDKKKFTNILTTSFMDLKHTHTFGIVQHFIKSLTLPFTKCGIVGCCVFPLYLIVAVPFLVLVYLFYLVPLIYFTARLLSNSLKILRVHNEKTNEESCAAKLSRQSSLCKEVIYLLPHYQVQEMRAKVNITIDNVAKHEKSVSASPVRHFLRFLVVGMMVFTMFGLSLLAAECVGFLAEIVTFTLMGIMVNAGVYLKFVSLIILILVYSHSCFSGVHKKYLKLNKSLFQQVKGMLSSQITEVTSQTAEHQENTAFKGETVADHLARAEKANESANGNKKHEGSHPTSKETAVKEEQNLAEHEDEVISDVDAEESECLLPKPEKEIQVEKKVKPEGLSIAEEKATTQEIVLVEEEGTPTDQTVTLPIEKETPLADDKVVPERHWLLSDVIFFIDRNDVPRMPKALFQRVCNINVDGSPGPVHLSMLSSLKKFLSIILFLAFVFILTSSFGAMYNISSTNQMLATLVGGLIPMLMRTFMTPPEDSMELNSVSFQGKLNEILRNMEQKWPIHDLEVLDESEGENGWEMGNDNNQEVDLVVISN